MSKINAPTMGPLSKEFVQPEGYPDTPTVNARCQAAVARLKVRGVVPQPNPLVTSWQLHALIKVLGRKGIFKQKDLDEVMYFIVWYQMQDLERLVDEKPASPLLIATPGPLNGH